jgi:hypothetical protein
MPTMVKLALIGHTPDCYAALASMGFDEASAKQVVDEIGDEPAYIVNNSITHDVEQTMIQGDVIADIYVLFTIGDETGNRWYQYIVPYGIKDVNGDVWISNTYLADMC